MKLLTDLQIWGCELHKNAFGGRTRCGNYSASTDPLAVIRGEGQERVGNREGRKGRT